MRIELPKKVNCIINRLLENGFDAYAVGGCVRDSIMGRIPDDWDITTSATPIEVKKIFQRTIDTGIAHGTVTVMLEHEGFEVTTYRIDGEYGDSRHPNSVSYTDNLLEDLKRRDFTLNAMAYNEVKGIVDVFGGMEDIKHKIIRCVGNAEDRFHEDALRILRAVRFSAQLGFDIEEKTKKAIERFSKNLTHISAERIQIELVKLIVSKHPEKLEMAYETGITKVILPEFDEMMLCEQNNPHHLYHVGEHTLKAVGYIENTKVLRLTMLFHDIAKPRTRKTDKAGLDHFHGHPELGVEMTRQILKRLRFDNDTLNRVCLLIQYHDVDIMNTKKAVRRAIHKIGEEYFIDLIKVKRADILAQSYYKREEKFENLLSVEKLYYEICKDEECVSLKTLAITGKDLISLGIKPGKQIGDILNELLAEVIDHPNRNHYEYLINKAVQMKEGTE
ncbi:tRNA nucleotidyltransferase (CCA-adding enzyme) [Lachnotalea glycerini]|uniref:CCA tRNA nucleotidyltransferase n=1 Tax=Lachnotalea glycerini TaxID=1763509 RepID=A0A255JGW3_9FIRM|nr:CCA tRNA nucleotidyltransferase [Lachnotalea glycerini]OYO51411.1 CCA tRNA nucleotidyltransferase [Lachnotalea glycerini]PXV91079.1 tRNA nucleotidyltransferase (CCA-adding enzyme) [Lachnotalea glycerini]RDY28469.1 CCA tRNA nucleotidyltransferase [Lachnotalea glycerini]